MKSNLVLTIIIAMLTMVMTAGSNLLTVWSMEGITNFSDVPPVVYGTAVMSALVSGIGVVIARLNKLFPEGLEPNQVREG